MPGKLGGKEREGFGLDKKGIKTQVFHCVTSGVAYSVLLTLFQAGLILQVSDRKEGDTFSRFNGCSLLFVVGICGFKCHLMPTSIIE